MPKLFYVPLEPYEQRYTGQLSCKGGWNEANWTAAGIRFKRIEGPSIQVGHIETGQVLDGITRFEWATVQLRQLMELAREGQISDTDVVFFDDFWTPGMAHLFYVWDQLDCHPRCYAQCWAQSVDEFDFTAKMLPWIRDFEKGIGKWMAGVFVANSMLKDLMVEAGVIEADRCHVTGLPFDSDEAISVWQKEHTEHPIERKNRVVFSSRCDSEKNPTFFLEVARRVWEEDPDVEFCICTSAPKLRSNDPFVLQAVLDFEKANKNFNVYEGLSKAGYYDLLYSSKIQFNCADQDWVSFTLLEASTFGCIPVYPSRRSFPETFTNAGGLVHTQYLYEVDEPTKAPAMTASQEVHNAAEKVIHHLITGEFTQQALLNRMWLHRRFDDTWARQATVMGLYDADKMGYVSTLYGMGSNDGE